MLCSLKFFLHESCQIFSVQFIGFNKTLKNRDMAYLKMLMGIVFGPMGCSVRLSISIF